MRLKNALVAVGELFSPNAPKRFEAQHKILSAMAVRCGFRLYSPNLLWFRDPEFAAIWNQYPESRPLFHERKFNLFHIARSLRDIPGDLAECGVHRGSSSFLMLAASEGTGKFLYGFDSFEGLSTPTEKDTVTIERTFKWKENDLSVPETAAINNLAKFDGKFTMYKGWIPNRFNEIEDRRFSLVHIDVDLYEPTLAALEFFWPRMSPGGIIVCDDYGFESCPGAKEAMDSYFQHKHPVIHLTTGQGLAIKRQP